MPTEMLRHSGPAQVFDERGRRRQGASPPTRSSHGGVVVIRNVRPQGRPRHARDAHAHVGAGRHAAWTRTWPSSPTAASAAPRAAPPSATWRPRRRPAGPSASSPTATSSASTSPGARSRSRCQRRNSRGAAAAKPPTAPRAGVTGYLARYVKLVSGAEKGAVLKMTAQEKIKGSTCHRPGRCRTRACEVMFGYPGGVVIPFFDALYNSDCSTSWRATSRAPCTRPTATRAPPESRRLPGHQRPRGDQPGHRPRHAYMDSIPMVAITGQVKADLIGNDAFQEADTTGITLPSPSTTTWSRTSTTCRRSSARPSTSPDRQAGPGAGRHAR